MNKETEIRNLKIKARHCKARMKKLKPVVEAYERVEQVYYETLVELTMKHGPIFKNDPES